MNLVDKFRKSASFRRPSSFLMSNDDRLKNLCGGDKETLERARDLLHIATQKTSQGSGFQLRDPIGLPGACALIASEE